MRCSKFICWCRCDCAYQRECVCVRVCACTSVHVCLCVRDTVNSNERRKTESDRIFCSAESCFRCLNKKVAKEKKKLPWISIRLEVTALKVASNGEWTWLIHTISLPKKLHCRSKSNLSYSVAEANEPDSTVIVSSRRNSTTIKGKETMREAFPSLPFGLPELEKQQQSSQQQQQQQRHHHYSSKDLTTGEIITSMCFLRSHRRTVLDIACFSPFTKCTAISQSSS